MSTSTLTLLFVMLGFLSLNTQGLVNHQKQLALAQYSRSTSSDILLLQETNLNSEEQIFQPQDFNFLINPPVQPASGVAIAISKTIAEDIKIISHQTPTPGYLQTLHFELAKQNYHIINVYMPHDNQKAQELSNLINTYHQSIQEDSVLILGGDWNTTLHQEDRRNCSEIRTSLVSTLKIIFQQHDLIDVWRDFNPFKQSFTFRGLQSNHPMARLDRFYMKSKDLHLVAGTEIKPSFSDHDGILLKVNTSQQKKYKTPYWKFDLNLLQSKEYQQIIKNIIKHFHEKLDSQDLNINTQWDNLKEEVSRASKRFLKKLKEENNQWLSTLQAQLDYIDQKEHLTPTDDLTMIQIRREISAIYNTNAAETLRLTESKLVNELNVQSKFFLRLAKQSDHSKYISQLEVNGQVTSEKNVIYKELFNTFKEEFSDSSINSTINPSSEIYSNLPTLTQEESRSCEEKISLEEIEEAINSAKLNKSPGMDGLPIEFYKFFWQDLKDIMIKLIQDFQVTSILPKSMKNIVVTPVPKKGDRLQIKNWRPISLLNTDYKIIARIFSKKIAQVSSSLLSSDQSYCVPGRTIYNNLHLLRNIINHANQSNQQLAIISLDQSGAFNKVSHPYLKHLLKIQGFGPTLINAITAMLLNTRGFIKIGSALLAPFPFLKGVRQGDPLAGPLFSISIEPFLRLINQENQLAGYRIPNSSINVRSTAFADDVNLFITNNEDFKKVPHCFQEYSQESGAKLNNQKSDGLFCGSWKTRSDHPFECKWSSDGKKFLGVHLGNNSKYEEMNWEVLITKTKSTLNKWSQFVKLTSYHGRKIIANQLAGSQLIHTLNVLQPPPTFIQEINKTMVNFVWQGKHWLHPNFLFANSEHGGMGLINLEAKINSLRLKLASDLQHSQDSQEPVHLFHHYNLWLCGANSHFHFFSQEKNLIDMANLQIFYKSLLNAWHQINTDLKTKKFPLNIIRRMPLYGSKIIDQEKIKILPDWKMQGITSIEKLLSPNGEWSIPNLQDLSNHTQRRLSYNFTQIKNYISKIITPTDNQVVYHFQLGTKTVIFPGTKKENYEACLKPLISNPPITGKPFITDKKIDWTTIYSTPADKKDADITWRLFHNALVTPRRLHQWNILPSSNCPWCEEKEGHLMHMFLECTQTKTIWDFTANKIKALSSKEITYEEALFGLPSSTQNSKICNYLLIMAKSTIYRTYMNIIKKPEPPQPSYLTILKRRLQYRQLIDPINILY